MKKNFLASRIARLFVAATIMVVGNLLVSCTDEGLRSKSNSFDPEIVPDDNRVAYHEFAVTCEPKDDAFVHTGKSRISIYLNGAETPEKVMDATLRSTCGIDRNPDTVRVTETGNEHQTAVSIARNFRDNKENDNVTITVSDGRVLTLPYSAEHASEKPFDLTYSHGHDSLLSARLIKVEQKAAPVLISKAAAQYVKDTYHTTYSVEVTTAAYSGSGKKVATDLDTLKTTAVTLLLDENGATDAITEQGVKVINETQQKDSVVVTKTWADGHTERMVFNTILNRSLKNIEKREVFVNSFANQSAGNSFSRVEGAESKVREDGNWTIYGREVVLSKMVSVNGYTEEVRYTLYQERADFRYNGISHSFGYVDWTVNNYADDFKSTAVSTKGDYDELDYKNEIRTSYLGYVQFVNEEIAWFKATVKVTGYGVINAYRKNYPTYSYVHLDKVAYYSDGTEKKVGEYSASMPIEVNPLTNWVINTDVWGVYTSNNFSGTLQGRTKKTAEKFFSFEHETYRFSNTVSSETNALEAGVPNKIVFDDGDVKHTFDDVEVKVSKGEEKTTASNVSASKSTYDYTCVANVSFGEASTSVTLPGTINIDTREHAHGKIVATYFTSTPNENRSYYKSVAVIQFSDGYRMVGMAENDGVKFEFNMGSNNAVNSAVYANNTWIPAIAEDNQSAGCMVWRDEYGTPKRTLDYITATRDRWNNGHNTIWDVRREGKISSDGCSVDFYFNGVKCQTLDF